MHQFELTDPVVATVAGAVYGVTGVSHEILNLAIVALILD